MKDKPLVLSNGGGGPDNTHFIKVLQNEVIRCILSFPARTSKNIIYPRMNVMKLENLYSYHQLMFLFKHKRLSNLSQPASNIQMRLESSLLASHTGWRRVHSRNQARYQSYWFFNKLAPKLRFELKLSTFKKGIRLLFGTKTLEYTQA